MKKKILLKFVLILIFIGFSFGLKYFLDIYSRNSSKSEQEDIVATSVAKTLSAKPTLTIIPTSMPTKTPSPTKVPLHHVTYEITGTTYSVNVTYTKSMGENGQDINVLLPVLINGYNVPIGTYLYVSAQNNWPDGIVNCNLYIDGNLWKTATATGGFGICSVSGFLNF